MTETLIDELTQDAISDIWNNALDWYIEQDINIHKEDRTYDLNPFFDESSRLLPFKQRIPITLFGWKFNILYLIDGIMIATLIMLIAYRLFGADSIFLTFMACFLASPVYCVATTPNTIFKPLTFWRIKNHKRKLKAYKFTTSQKLNICADFLMYQANIAKYDAEEEVDEINKKLKKHETESKATNTALANFNHNGALQQIQHEAYKKQSITARTLCELHEQQNHIIGNAKRQMHLAKSFYALASLCEEHTLTHKLTMTEAELLDDETIYNTKQNIEKMSQILKNVTEEANTLPKGPIRINA